MQILDFLENDVFNTSVSANGKFLDGELIEVLDNEPDSNDTTR